MAPRGAKRSVSSPVHHSESPRKLARAGSLQRKFDTIAGALDEYDELPKCVRQMLVSVLPTSLGVKQDQRHGYQEQVVAMIESELHGLEGKISASIQSEEATVANADCEKARRESAKTDAETALAAKVEEVAVKLSAVELDVAAHTTAKDALKEAKVAQKSGDKELEDAGKSKEKLEGAIKDLYEPLKVGEGLKPAESKRLLNNLGAYLKKISFDHAMAAAAHVALQKASGERTSFDQLVLTQVDADLSRRVAALEAKLAEGLPGKEARQAAADAAHSLVEVADSKRSSSIEAHDAAESEEAALRMSCNEATQSFEDHALEVKTAVLSLQAAKERLTEFQEGPLAAFKELKERSTPPPVVEEVAADHVEAMVEDDSTPPAAME